MHSETPWTHKFKNSFKDLQELYRFLDWPLPPELEQVASTYPLFVPQDLALMIKEQGPEGPLAKEFLPHPLEIDPVLNQSGMIDPIGDKSNHKAPQLIHRYPSRALFTPTSVCPVHCRYCFRKNELSPSDDLFQAEFERTLNYLNEHPEISEIIFTGGDPFTLSNEKIQNYLKAFAEISSIQDIRFHSRYPVILPERIDQGLIEVLAEARKRFRFVSVAIHANHVSEFGQKSLQAIRNLSEAPIQLLSQTVLLKGVNDTVEQLKELLELFLELRVRPYYLHHPDSVKGGMHFYTSLEEGRKLYGALRRLLPGWAIPQYVLDVPGGLGKIPAFNPEGSKYSGQLLSMDGATVELQEPDFFI